MNVEENRLRTYDSWPANAAISPERLAKAGFYCTGRALEVQCFLCRVKISDWNYGDQAMMRHRQAVPECPFVLHPTETCNVPLIPQTDAPPVREEHDEDAASVSQSPDPCGKYTRVLQRLKSFDNWPIPFIVSPPSLARAGFYYLQDNARVKCAFCEGVITKWDPGDDPFKKHRQYFPNCNFFNHPYIAEVLTAEKGELSNVKLVPGTSVDLSELGVQRHTAPRKPKHSTYEGRLRTYEGWPENLKQTPEMLAVAGFYYVGTDDQVRCFHCDGGLRNWEETDDAWTEHARWFPKCGFVALVRGQDFIKHCIDNRPPLDPSILLGVPEDGEEDVTSVSQLSSVPTNARSRSRDITDAEVENLLSSEPAMVALGIGLNVGRVKMAIKRRIEATGLPYANADELIEDVRHVQLAEENDIPEMTNVESPSSELSNLLNQVITLQSNRGPPDPIVHDDISTTFIKKIEKRRRKIENGESSNDSSRLDTERVLRQMEPSPIDRTTALEEENRRLKEARLCKICMDREVCVVFLPCGHLATCVHCAPSLTHCPMCRQEIRATSSKATWEAESSRIHEEIGVRPEISSVKSEKMTDIIEHCDLRDNHLVSMKQTIVPTSRLSLFAARPQASTTTVDEVDNRDYRMEEVRLRSYATWPVPFLEPAKMAAAGFYYTGEGDTVRCFECKVEICQWVEGDNPMADHQRWQEQCRFIRKIPCGNVPIGENPNSVPQPRPRGHDVCGPYDVEYRPGSTADCHFQSPEFSLPSTAKLGSLGIGRPKGPANPEYASYDARLRTFESWPKSMPQTKECLADAGFYYTGKGDQTLCYHCGGGLKDWEPNDDPWEQHAKWFSKCYYLLMVKGQAYVNTVTGQTIALPSNEETMQMNLPSYIKKVEPKESSDAQKEAKKSCNAGTSGQSGSSPVEAASKAHTEKQEKATVVTNSEAGTTSSEENVKKPIDDARLCKICYGEELGVVFLPCGHMVACVKCAPGMVTCALCRQSVSMTVRAFFS